MGNSVCANSYPQVTGVIELLCLQMQKLLLYSSSAGGTLLKCRPSLPGRYTFVLAEGHSLASLMKEKQGEKQGEKRKCSLS